MEKIKTRWRKNYLEGDIISNDEAKDENCDTGGYDRNNSSSSNSSCINNISNHLDHHHRHSNSNHHYNHHNHHHHHNHHNSSNNNNITNSSTIHLNGNGENNGITKNHKHHHHKHRHHHHSKHSPSNYEPITENIYVDKRRNDHSKSRKEARSMVCDCVLTKEERARGATGCLDDCLNRMLMIECGPKCTLGEHCLNKRFQKSESAKVEVFKTKKKGWGLRTMTALPSGSFVMEYVGEVVRCKEFRSRVKKYTKQKIKHHYFMALKNDEVIDATFKGNLTRFINHSCEPNCETQKWTVNGELRIGFFTIKDLEQGEEITFDYQFQRYGRKAQKCHCDAPTCRKYIGGEAQTYSLDGQTSPQNENENDNDDDEEDDEDEAERKANDPELGLDFKIPRLNRKEIEKKTDEEDLDHVNSKKRSSIESNYPFYRSIPKPSTTNGLINNSTPKPHTAVTNATAFPIKRKYDTIATNNIDLTPAPKISKEEHRLQFEYNVMLKDWLEKTFGPSGAERLRRTYPTLLNGTTNTYAHLIANQHNLPFLGAFGHSLVPPIPPPLLVLGQQQPPPPPLGMNQQQVQLPQPPQTPNQQQQAILTPAAAVMAGAPLPAPLQLAQTMAQPTTPLTSLTGSTNVSLTQIATPLTIATTTNDLDKVKIVKPNPTNIPTLIVLANHSIEPANAIDDELAFSICDYDEYYSLRNRPLSAEDVFFRAKTATYPYPGSYYTTPNGETWFATITMDKKTQEPRTVILKACGISRVIK